VDDSAEGRTLQDCAGEHRPGLNASIMLHLGTALRAYYDDDLSSLSVRHVVIDAAVPTEDLDSPQPNPEMPQRLGVSLGRCPRAMPARFQMILPFAVLRGARRLNAPGPSL